MCPKLKHVLGEPKIAVKSGIIIISKLSRPGLQRRSGQKIAESLKPEHRLQGFIEQITLSPLSQKLQNGPHYPVYVLYPTESTSIAVVYQRCVDASSHSCRGLKAFLMLHASQDPANIFAS
jgi:hypothetical protein